MRRAILVSVLAAGISCGGAAAGGDPHDQRGDDGAGAGAMTLFPPPHPATSLAPDDDDGGDTASTATSSAPTSTSSGGSDSTTSMGLGESSDSTGEGSSSTGLDPGTDQVPPLDEASLLAWLQSGVYTAWAHESASHMSKDGHAGQVQIYLNELLHASLTTGTTPHPVDATAVKELYNTSGSELKGWAVTIKVEEGGGQLTWLFFEHSDGLTFFNEIGAGPCAGCHSKGADYVRVLLPLQ